MKEHILGNSAVSENLNLLTAWIESQMVYRGQPGLSIGIIYDQQLVWTRGFGYANLAHHTPATPQTIYRIASITKLFTATAVLHLRDAGKLQLDAPLTNYLPWFTIQNPYPAAPPITVRHLLTHTAGLPREAAFPYWSDAQFPTWEQIQAQLPQQQAALATETRWKYSNLGLALAGELVSAVSGLPYPQYIQQHILQPLAMNSTFVESVDPHHPQLATGYGRRLPDGIRAFSPFTDCQGIAPAANIATTVEDLAKFAMLQFRDAPAGGSQILRGSTLREMQRVHWLQPDWQAGWGLGFRVQHLYGKTIVGHGGAVLGYRTLVAMCPAEKTAVICLTNADDGLPLLYVEKAYQWVIPAILQAVNPYTPKTADPAWQHYVGKYRNVWGDMEILVWNGRLIAIDPSQPDPLIFPTTLTPIAEHIFLMETADGFGSHGELMVFEMNENGQVEQIKAGENYTYPIHQW